MAKRHTKRAAPRKRKQPSRWNAERVARVVRIMGVAGAAVVAVATASYGLTRLDAHVRRSLADRAAPTLVFRHLPAVLGDRVEGELRAVTAGLLKRPWTDDRLCRDIAERVETVGWVKRVIAVQRAAAGRFEISCRYRTPIAMTQVGTEFHLIDTERVRLPGTYRYDSTYPLVQGIARPPPAAGQVWPGEDLRAGLALIEALDRTSFAHQVTAVLVENLDGRKDARATHIELATDRAGGRIRWGSAPGREIEENSVAEKLAILEANYHRTGRIDARYAVIDISTLPDRFTVPG